MATKTTAASSPDPEYWNYELFGCFDDFKLCIFTFLLPCYTAGRNAEGLGEEGTTVGKCPICDHEVQICVQCLPPPPQSHTHAPETTQCENMEPGPILLLTASCIACCLQCEQSCCYNRICASLFASLLAWLVCMGPKDH